MEDSDTLADGSLVTVDETVADGQRIHFESSFMTNSVLAALNSVGDNVAKVYMGLLASGADVTPGNLTEADFEFGVMYYKNGTNDYRIRYIYNGGFTSNTGLGSNGSTFSWELFFANNGGENQYELSTAPSSLNPETYYMSQDGGNWSSYYFTSSIPSGSGAKTWHIGVTGTTMDISTIGVLEHDIPQPPTTDLTDSQINYTPSYGFSVGSTHSSYEYYSAGDAAYDDFGIDEIALSGSFMTIYFKDAGSMGTFRSAGHTLEILADDGSNPAWEFSGVVLNSAAEYSASTAYNYVHYVLHTPAGGYNNWNDMVALTAANQDANVVDFVITPAANTNDTSWTKALDFSGSAERTEMVTGSYYYNPMMMAGTNNQVAAPTAGNTVSSGHPWATAVVFKHDANNSNQHIWNLGEGAGTNDDNIYLRLAADQQLYFGWGRDGDYNECQIGFLNSSTWGGIYIANNGARFGDGCTAAQLASAFDIRLLINKPGGWDFVTPTGFSSSNIAAEESRWTQTGGRMNRQYSGKLTLGGRGANRSYNGKIASFVTTTLKCGVAMPDDAEILEMVTDPQGWLTEYRVRQAGPSGGTFRHPSQTTTNWTWALSSGLGRGAATQIWLMGDGQYDSYSNMIRNQVHPTDQNYFKMNMISMVSNDIQNVNIPGLT